MSAATRRGGASNLAAKATGFASLLAFLVIAEILIRADAISRFAYICCAGEGCASFVGDVVGGFFSSG